MSLNLKPLFADNTTEQSLATVAENIQKVAGMLYVSEASDQERYIKFLETATRIKEHETREAFVGLACEWRYSRNLLLEAHKALKTISEQMGRVQKSIDGAVEA